MDYKEIGRRVRQRRLELGLTQEETAEKAGVSMSYVGQIERGEKLAALETTVRLCEVLGVGLDWLVYGKRETRCDRTRCAMIRDLMKLIEAYT